MLKEDIPGGMVWAGVLVCSMVYKLLWSVLEEHPDQSFRPFLYFDGFPNINVNFIVSEGHADTAGAVPAAAGGRVWPAQYRGIFPGSPVSGAPWELNLSQAAGGGRWREEGHWL